MPPDVVAIPPTHLDLLTGPICAVLTTMMPDGQPQSSLVWIDYDGECIRTNTTRERQKGRNMGRNPRVSMLVVDPENTGRYIQVRGDAELVEAGAIDHLDALTRKYTSHPCFYGYVHPGDRQAHETRVICRVHAKRVTLNAIHK